MKTGQEVLGFQDTGAHTHTHTHTHTHKYTLMCMRSHLARATARDCPLAGPSQQKACTLFTHTHARTCSASAAE